MNDPVPFLRQSRSAFTLIELLCVCAILLLLVALLMPAVDAARDRAQTSACQSNQRQLAVGFQGYCSDNRGAFACYTSSGGEARPWFYYRVTDIPPNIDYSLNAISYLSEYTGGSSNELWYDPAVPVTGSGTPVYGYAISAVLGRDVPAAAQYARTVAGGRIGPVSLSELPSPGTTALLACRIARNARFQNLYTAGPSGYARLAMTNESGGTHQAWALHGPWFRPGVRTLTNVVRIDGSVRTYQTKEIILNGNVYGVPYGQPPTHPAYYMSALRQYLWSGYPPGFSNLEYGGILSD